MSDDLLTSSQLGHLLGVSTRTIHRRVEDGELVPTQQLPGPTGAYLFRRKDVEHLVTAAREAAHQRVIDLGEQPTERVS